MQETTEASEELRRNLEKKQSKPNDKKAELTNLRQSLWNGGTGKREVN
jgi:hypothetical protein